MKRKRAGEKIILIVQDSRKIHWLLAEVESFPRQPDPPPLVRTGQGEEETVSKKSQKK